MTDARVFEIFIAQDKGEPMKSVNQVEAIAGVGLEGDRYAMGKGAFSKNLRVIRHVTLIGLEHIGIANSGLKMPYSFAETRRNIVTENIDVNGLVGREFRIGQAVMRGVELCDPCVRPEKLSGKSGFKESFELLSGIRAEVLETGWVANDDPIEIIGS